MASRVLSSMRGACQSWIHSQNILVSEKLCPLIALKTSTGPSRVPSHRALHATAALQWNATLPIPLGNGSGSSLLSVSPLYLPKRWMSRPALTKKHIRERIMLNLQLFDKINAEKLKLDSHFHKDLGLDSLDHVEIIMAIEDEFGFEIPDMDAQRLLCATDIARYVCDKYDVFDEDEHHDGHGHDDHGHEETKDPWAKGPAKTPAHH